MMKSTFSMPFLLFISLVSCKHSSDNAEPGTGISGNYTYTIPKGSSAGQGVLGTDIEVLFYFTDSGGKVDARIIERTMVNGQTFDDEYILPPSQVVNGKLSTKADFTEKHDNYTAAWTVTLSVENEAGSLRADYRVKYSSEVHEYGFNGVLVPTN